MRLADYLRCSQAGEYHPSGSCRKSRCKQIIRMNKHLIPHLMKPLLDVKKYILVCENTPPCYGEVHFRIREYTNREQRLTVRITGCGRFKQRWRVIYRLIRAVEVRPWMIIFYMVFYMQRWLVIGRCVQ